MESRFRKSRQTIKRCGLRTFSRITILTMSLATILLSVWRSPAKFYNTLKQIWHNFSCFRTQSMNFSRKFVNAGILASEKWNKISRTRILQSHSCMHKKSNACMHISAWGPFIEPVLQQLVGRHLILVATYPDVYSMSVLLLMAPKIILHTEGQTSPIDASSILTRDFYINIQNEVRERK